MSVHSDLPPKKRKLAPGLSRRTHTKSRNGCQTCKSRKIKCSMEHPYCQNCIHRALTCTYPSSIPRQPENAIVKNPPRLLPQSRALSNSNTLEFHDLRFFHHFLTVAYPHLPAGNQSTWTMQIPLIASNQPYLMHAILGLGASHLHRINPDRSYYSAAVAHRFHAIAGLHSAVTNASPSSHEADAMLAAAYSLTFQATYMDDGLIDFMTLVRGCALITSQIQSSSISTSFSLQPDAYAYVSTLEPRVSALPPIDPDILTTGLHALSRISPILSSSIDLAFFFSLKSTLSAALHSGTRAGFVEFAKIYNVWFESSSSSFNELIDSNNKAAQVLLAYFTAIQLLMAPVTMPMYQPPKLTKDMTRDVLAITMIWARKLFDEVPENYKRYIGWPVAVVERVEREMEERSHQRKRGGWAFLINMAECSDGGGSEED